MAVGLLFRALTEPGNSIYGLWLFDVKEQTVRPLGGEAVEVATFPLVRSGPPVWSEDSSRLAFMSSRRGVSEIATLEVPGGKMAQILSGERQVTNLHGCGRWLAFSATSVGTPGEVSIVAWDGNGEKTLTHINDHWWRERRAPRAEKRTFSVEKKKIEGWLLLPPGSSAENEPKRKPMPLLIDVHGGPFSYAELGFPYHVQYRIARGDVR